MSDQEHHVDTDSTGDGWWVEEWKPTFGISLLWNLLGLLLVAAGLALFGLLGILLGGGVTRLAGLNNLLIIVLIVVGTLVVHELLHAAAMRMFGARPQFGVALVQKIMPAAYCTAPGHWFTRNQFFVVALAPLGVMSLIGILFMPFGNMAEWLIVPLSLNLGGAIGDIWFAGMLFRRAPDTMIEDLRDGLRFHYPLTG